MSYVPLVASCSLLWGNDKKLLKVERPLTLEKLNQKIKASYPKLGDDFSVSYRAASDETRYIELTEVTFDEFLSVPNMHIDIVSTRDPATLSPRGVTPRKKAMSMHQVNSHTHTHTHSHTHTLTHLLTHLLTHSLTRLLTHSLLLTYLLALLGG